MFSPKFTRGFGVTFSPDSVVEGAADVVGADVVVAEVVTAVEKMTNVT